jgi:hypothetical protein
VDTNQHHNSVYSQFNFTEMKVQISFGNYWIRADFICENGSKGRNLYETRRNLHDSLLKQLKVACDYVRYFYALQGYREEIIEFIPESPAYSNLIDAASK